MLSRVYGYARVSVADQNAGRQIEALLKADVMEQFIFVDKQSGKDFDRPQYLLIKNALREGDLLIIKSIDRLGRNYKEVMNEWRDITQEIKADIKVLDMPLLDTTLNRDLLGTFISDIVLQILAYVAEQEREFIRQRQREGIDLAKKQGKSFGRPKVQYPENFVEIYTAWRNKDITGRRAIEKLNLKTTTFYKLVSDYEKEGII